MKNKLKKIISIFIMAAMLLTSFTVVFADGEPEVTMSLEVEKSISIYGACLGEEFDIDFNLEFGDDLILREGIAILYAQLKFDPEVMEPVLNGEDYAAVADYVEGDALSVRLSEAGDCFTILYGTTSSANIIETGRLLTLTFKAKEELEVVDKIETDFRIVNPSAHGADMTYDDMGEITGATSFDCVVDSSNKMIKVTPPYRMKDITAKQVGSTLSVNGVCFIDESSDEPLMATITDDDGDTVFEQEVTIISGVYRLVVTLDEETFAPGKYTLTLSHGVTSGSKSFTILAKDEPLPEPEPDEDEPGTDDEPDDETDDTNKDEADTDEDKKDDETDKKDETSDNKNTGGAIGGGVSDKKDTSTDKADSTDKTDDKVDVPAPPKNPDIVYPNDIEGHWAQSNIEYVYTFGLMNGYENGCFDPDNSITRAEFATVMVRFLGLEENPAAADRFSDTDGHWAKGYIGALAASRIVDGVSETEFEPDSEITREQIAVILDRAFDLPPEDNKGAFFDDPIISIWAYDAVYDVLAAGYMQGDTTGNFNPQANATRAEVATIIYRLHIAK